MTNTKYTFEQTWRWFGPDDPVPLSHIKMAGATGIVTSLHQIPIGDVWPLEEILKRKNEIENKGLRWSVVESIPVHNDIKKRSGSQETKIDNYRQSLLNLGRAGIDTVCYNFMPVLDWTRTDLSYELANGSKALRFDAAEFAAFDLFILKRKGAESEYTEDQKKEARMMFESLGNDRRDQIVRNITAGLPGGEGRYTLEDLKIVLSEFTGMKDQDLRNHLYAFLGDVIPAAEDAGIRMAIHPDDPPFPLLGLPRVVSTESDAKQLLNAVDSLNNGLCFCTGSYGVHSDNDLPGMVKRLGDRIHFIHLRSTKRDEKGNFYEADHLDGDVDMYSVMRALIEEQVKRIESGRKDLRIPFRPDHGHLMLDDLNKHTFPGYSAIGRLRGLAELRGLEMGIREGMPIGSS